MNKICLSLLVFLFFVIVKNQGQNDNCLFDDLINSGDVEYQNSTLIMNQAYLDWMADSPHMGSYEIPVVFHIMHNNGPENINDNQIYEALKQTNEQFQGIHNGNSTGFNTGITLKLASIDPYGNCTSGINRVHTSNPYGSVASSSDANLKNLSRWDTEKYLNIWVVAGITFGGAGYTFLPSIAPVSPVRDGIVIRHDFLGNTGTANNNIHNVLSHEVGHYLGLYHVWGDKESICVENCHDYNQTNNIDNCLTHGDWVCDTNPAFERFTEEDCTDDITSCENCPVDLMLSYPKDNYMGYTYACQNKFTSGQAERMWFTLEEYRSGLWSSENLQCTGVGDHYGHNITVTGIEEWNSTNLPNNGHIIITGTLTVEAGARLTINDSEVKIHFCEFGRIVVKQGGMLINEATLTNACEVPWKGIEVWGTTAAAQGNYFSHADHGVLILRNGAVVENAEIGVKLYGPDYLNDGGGIISCHKASFINNGTAAHFAPYDLGGDYSGYFSRCTFHSDGGFIPFSSFLDLNDVKGIKISGSSFTYTGGPSFGQDVEQYRYGIWAKNSGFKLKSTVENDKFGNPIGVGRCTFSGLGYGIWISNLLGNKYYEIEQAVFENCYTGIYNSGMSLGRVLFNDFNLGSVPNPSLIADTETKSQIGVHFENPIVGVSFEQNEFNSSNSSFNTTGTFFNQTANFNNIIRKNIFNANTFGNIATNVNGGNFNITKGLTYLCNELNSTELYDFSIVNTIGPDRINPNQGTYSSLLTQENNGVQTYFSAGNTFSYNSNQYGDFFNDGGSDTNYWYYENPSPNEEPMDYLGINLLSTEHEGICAATYCEPPCPIIIMDSPDKDIIKDHFVGVKDEYNAFISSHFGPGGLPEVPYNPFGEIDETNSIEISPKVQFTLSHYKEVMDRSIQQALQIIASDSSYFDFNSYAWWIAEINSYEGDIWLAQEYAASGNWLTANSILNNLPLKYNLVGEAQQDFNNISTIFTILQTENIFSDGMSNYELELQNIAQIGFGYAPMWANNILNTMEANFPVQYYLPNSRTENRSNNEYIRKKKEITNGPWVYPNPSSGTLSIECDKKIDSELEFRLLNLNGNELLFKVMSNNEKIDISSLKNGVYLYSISSGGKILFSNRLIILK